MKWKDAAGRWQRKASTARTREEALKHWHALADQAERQREGRAPRPIDGSITLYDTLPVPSVLVPFHPILWYLDLLWVHRYVCAAWLGPKRLIGRDVHHRCQSPACVEPRHLVPVTNVEHLAIHCGVIANPPAPRQNKSRRIIMWPEMAAACLFGARTRRAA